MFSKFELTDKGVELLNKVIAEKKTLKFTKFQLGKGEFSGDKKTLAQLVSKFDEFNVTQTSVLSDGITNIKGFYDNRNLSVASKLTEIGIFAQAGDETLTEVLFSYTNQPSTDAEAIPSKESYFSRTFSVMNRTDNVTSITFDLSIRQDKYNFGALEEMKAADYLDVGDKVALWGNTELGDSPFRLFIITNETQEIQLNNMLYAKEYLNLDDKQDKTDNGLKGTTKDVVENINESFWRVIPKYIGNSTTPTDLDTIIQEGFYLSTTATNKFEHLPPQLNRTAAAFYMKVSYNGNYAKQVLKHMSNNRLFIRTKNMSYWMDWVEVLTEESQLFLGNAGIKKVNKIQDNIPKNKNEGYIDDVTGKLYICFPEDGSNTTNDTTVSKNFIPADNISNAKYDILFGDKETEVIRVTSGSSQDVTIKNINNYKALIFYASTQDTDTWSSLTTPTIIDVYTFKTRLINSQVLENKSGFILPIYNNGEYITVNYLSDTKIRVVGSNISTGKATIHRIVGI